MLSMSGFNRLPLRVHILSPVEAGFAPLLAGIPKHMPVAHGTFQTLPLDMNLGHSLAISSKVDDLVEPVVCTVCQKKLDREVRCSKQVGDSTLTFPRLGQLFKMSFSPMSHEGTFDMFGRPISSR